MNRRGFLSTLAAHLSRWRRGALRAHAQATASASLTYGQSTAVVTLDPVHGLLHVIPRAAVKPRCVFMMGC